MSLSRRSFLAIVPVSSVLGGSLEISASTPRSFQGPAPDRPRTIPESFPTQDPALARETVAVSHGNAARVRELVSGCPALAKASWDWGYGDWETALGAASHVGNREIADVLLKAGAPPTIFSAAMLGQLTVVQGMIAASPGIQRTKGPHGIPLLDHAKFGGAAEVVKYLETLGDAEPRYTNESLPDEDRKAILGDYSFGSGATDHLSVTVNPRGNLVIQRTGATERNLFHLGSRVFHPPGAETVRIRFAPGPSASSVTIEDGPLVVTARRVSGVPGL
jgi:hypothetical protein